MKLKRRAWQEKWLKLDLNCPDLLDACDLVYEFCADYAKRPSVGRMLVMVGENGCGKTHISKAVNRWAAAVSMMIPLVASDDGFSTPNVIYANWPRICDGYKNGEFEVSEDLAECSLLIIDDIGAEHDPSKVGTDKLCQILSRRENKWTIVATNILTGSWMNKFDRRVSSRLFRKSTIIDMTKIKDYWATK